MTTFDLEVLTRPIARLPAYFVHRLNLQALDHLEQGDYDTYVFYDWHLPPLYYDNDDCECLCEAEECKFDWEVIWAASTLAADENADPADHHFCTCGQIDCEKINRKHRWHAPVPHAVCLDRDGGYHVLPIHSLRTFPPEFTPPIVDGPSRREGWLYAVATQPDLSLHRVKLGFTTDPNERMKAFRTLCPRSLLLGIWEADGVDEEWLFAAIRGYRFYESEEFDLVDPFETLKEIPTLLQQRHVAHDAETTTS